MSLDALKDLVLASTGFSNLDYIKHLVEECNPKAIDELSMLGMSNGTNVEVKLEGKKWFKGKLHIAGEDPINKPIIWFKGKGKGTLIPLYEVSDLRLSSSKGVKND